MDRKKTEIITIASVKGGVGKSALAIIFSYILKNFNKKVLLVDLDPQNSLTSYFIRHIKSIEGINVYYMFKDYQDFDPNKYLNEINNNMYIVPSHPILCKFEQEDKRYKEQLLEYCVKKILINNNFDYILIDTPPSLGPLLYNALNITNKVIIPVQLERWSVEAFPMLMDAIEEVNLFKDKKIDISIVENQFIKNRNTFIDVEKQVLKKYSILIKGKIHSFNSVKVLINELKEPDVSAVYYKEAQEALEKIVKVRWTYFFTVKRKGGLMSKKERKEIILNDRKTSINQLKNNCDKDDEIEYESYKNQIRRIATSEIDNRIELMKILYKIRTKKLYKFDGYKKFDDFLKKFVIARSQAFLYLRLYKHVLSGDLKIDEIKQLGFAETYSRIKRFNIDKGIAKEKSIRILRLQLENQESYDFYGKNAKFTGYFLDRVFIEKKDLLEKFMEEFKSWALMNNLVYKT